MKINKLTNALSNLPALFGHILNHQAGSDGVWEFKAIGRLSLLGCPLGTALSGGHPLGATLGSCSLAGRHGGGDAGAPLTRCCPLWNGGREALP